MAYTDIMDYDIIIYAVIAVLVLARLWSVLGQRNGEDRERTNPFATPPVITPKASAAGAPDGLPASQPKLFAPLAYAPESLAGGLAQIKAADAGFDEKQFLQKARTWFTQILGDYAKGDLSSSTLLLSAAVLANFRAAVEARHAAKQTLEHKLVKIDEAECVSARMENDRAMITVRFQSQQESVLRDANNQIVDGSEGKPESVVDIWTFMRNPQSSDPNWMLIETRS